MRYFFYDHHKTTALPEDKAAPQPEAASSAAAPALAAPEHACPCGGGCPRCAGVQAKLEVSQPADPLEQEADRAAASWVGPGAGQALPPASTSSAPLPAAQATGVPEIDNLAGGGEPLSEQSRSFFEPRLGQDLSSVRVHADAQGAALNAELQAKAFTHGNHIVFGQGTYAPETGEGAGLLAHELAHTQQQDRAGAKLLRKWDPLPPEEVNNPKAGKLERVVVDQEIPETVTLHWDDGTLESDVCSSGKGHSCVPASDPTGTAGSVEQTQQNDSNLTPISKNEGFPIFQRCNDADHWPYWSEFVPSPRAIALHYYPTVNGEPLSHGCVRLHEETAKKIYVGARRNQTKVQVRGFARPRCESQELKNAWADDFDTAAQDPREITDPKERANVQTERRQLNRAFGGNLQPQDYATLSQRGIPRAAQHAPVLTPEEQNLRPEAMQNPYRDNSPYEIFETHGSESQQIMAKGRFESLYGPFMQALTDSANLRAALRAVSTHGQRLWTKAVQRVQGGDQDDRALFLTRTLLTRALHQWQPSFRLTDAQRQDLIERFDKASRGLESAAFTSNAQTKKILVSGFDPFNGGATTANPSGAAALALDGKVYTVNGVRAEVQAVVLPVSFERFNTGLVESFFRPYMQGRTPANMIVALGMGATDHFELEEYAGPPNAASTHLAAQETPPKFHRTTLPVDLMRRQALGRNAANPDETTVTEIPAGATEAREQAGGPTAGSTAVEGTAGAFLCNEIFYRLTLLRDQVNPTLRVGFIHTPLLKPPETGLTSPDFESQRSTSIQTVENLIKAALPVL